MTFTQIHCVGPSRFELAAAKLLLCAQAAGADHQTPMTRVPAAAAQGEIVRRAATVRFAPRQVENDMGSMYCVAIFLAALTAFLAAVLARTSHPLAAVLLMLGGMTLLLEVISAILCDIEN